MVNWTTIAVNVLITVVIAIIGERVFGFHHLAVIPLALGAGIAFYYRQSRRGL